MMEQTLWHPVAQTGDVQDQPLAVQLLGQALVLWRSADGAAHAWADRCPHRGAKLSLGRVRNGRLECGYHGWQFDAQAQCVHVPALPQFVPPATHCATRYALQEAYGLVWVRLAQDSAASPALPALPAFAAESDARLRKVNCGPYLVATSAPRIVENFLDLSHFGFVHEGWLGAREHTDVPDYDVHRTPTGILATRCMAWQPKSSLHAQTGAMVEYSYEVTAPYACVLTKIPEARSVQIEGFRESIALFVCPITPEYSRVWIRMAMTDFASPDSSLQSFQNTIFGQDQPVLESQQPKCLPLGPRAELHTAADKASSAYRRYLQETGITFGVC